MKITGKLYKILIIQRIKSWFSNYRKEQRRKQTLEIIKKAKQAYLDGKEPCMCFCFWRVEPLLSSSRSLAKRIPEFKPSTFGLNKDDISGLWWPSNDRASRIKAFDKLIEIYSK